MSQKLVTVHQGETTPSGILISTEWEEVPVEIALIKTWVDLPLEELVRRTNQLVAVALHYQLSQLTHQEDRRIKLAREGLARVLDDKYVPVRQEPYLIQAAKTIQALR